MAAQVRLSIAAHEESEFKINRQVAALSRANPGVSSAFLFATAVDATGLSSVHGRLLLNGVVNMMQDKFVAAETFFEAAVTFQPQSVLAWTMFGSSWLCLYSTRYSGSVV